MFIAGIDGGGTSTRLEIRDADNTFIRRESFGAFNISAIGEDAFSARLDEVFAACGDMSECAALCIGAAGLSLSQTERIIHWQLELAHFCGTLRLCGDHEIALRGAMDRALRRVRAYSRRCRQRLRHRARRPAGGCAQCRRAQ